jgi:uncharacterized protein YbaP (TraB family)
MTVTTKWTRPTRLSAEDTDVVLTALANAGALAFEVGYDDLLEQVNAAVRAMGVTPMMVHASELSPEQRQQLEASAIEAGVDPERIYLRRRA